MSIIVTVPKIGTGKGTDEAYRPETDATHWQVIEERETDFVIEILS